MADWLIIAATPLSSAASPLVAGARGWQRRSETRQKSKKKKRELEREAAKAEREAKKAQDLQVKSIQNLCSRALQKISATKAKLEKICENKQLLDKAGTIAKKEAEGALRTLRSIASTATEHVSAGSISEKDKKIIEGYEVATKKGEAAFKAING